MVAPQAEAYNHYTEHKFAYQVSTIKKFCRNAKCGSIDAYVSDRPELSTGRPHPCLHREWSIYHYLNIFII